jgi:hypothetical protein
LDVEFIGQPFGAQFGELLGGALVGGRFNRLRIACAWGKRSGLSRVSVALRQFRDAGGSSEAVLGVDEGGATREGLQLAMELFDEPRIFYDPGQRTFHPKAYVLEGDGAVVGVGSWNLTKGGLFTNYEAGIVAHLAAGEDADLLRDVHRFIDELVRQEANCRILDDDLYRALLANRRFGIEPETTQYRRRRAERRERGAEDEPDPVFGPAIGGLPGAPAADLPVDEVEEEDDDDSTIASPLPPPSPPAPPPGGEGVAAGVTGFWKQLSNFDVSRTGAPGQIIIPIRFRDFFGPMVVQKDETGAGGVRQSHVLFDVRFVDGDFELYVTQARAILYEPAADHPRPNIELRFTFRNRDAFDRLSAGDVLVFSRSDGIVRVERRAQGTMGAGKFGQLD